MDTERNEQPGWQSEGESLNTGSAGNDQDAGHTHHEEKDEKKKGGIHNNALYAASMGRSATAAVNPHNDNSGLEQTGTNPGYEGPLAPGAGGSVGTGYASGQSAANPTIRTDSDYDMTRMGHSNEEEEGTADRPSEEADPAL